MKDSSNRSYIIEILFFFFFSLLLVIGTYSFISLDLHILLPYFYYLRQLVVIPFPTNPGCSWDDQ